MYGLAPLRSRAFERESLENTSHEFRTVSVQRVETRAKSRSAGNALERQYSALKFPSFIRLSTRKFPAFPIVFALPHGLRDSGERSVGWEAQPERSEIRFKEERG